MFLSSFDELRGPYREKYMCLSMSDPQNPNRGAAKDNMGKLILPPSALDHLTRLNIDFPMFFRLTYGDRFTHCGVLEFTAPERVCFAPNWIREQLEISTDYQLISVEYVNLPTATFARFQPENVDFFDIYDHKAVLENALRQFACLTEGDRIVINYNEKQYPLNVLNTEPNKAVSIVECDMRVEFAEPEVKSVKDDVAEEIPVEIGPTFPGSGRRLDGKDVKPNLNKTKNEPTIHGIPDYDYKPNTLTFFRNYRKPSVAPTQTVVFKAFAGEGKSLRKK